MWTSFSNVSYPHRRHLLETALASQYQFIQNNLESALPNKIPLNSDNISNLLSTLLAPFFILSLISPLAAPPVKIWAILCSCFLLYHPPDHLAIKLSFSQSIISVSYLVSLEIGKYFLLTWIWRQAVQREWSGSMILSMPQPPSIFLLHHP